MNKVELNEEEVYQVLLKEYLKGTVPSIGRLRAFTKVICKHFTPKAVKTVDVGEICQTIYQTGQWHPTDWEKEPKESKDYWMEKAQAIHNLINGR